MNVLVSIALAGCSTYQAHSNLATPHVPTDPSKVQILYSPPQRAYISIGIVSANRYKLGWTDTTVGDGIPQLHAAAAQIGALIYRASKRLSLYKE
ncbi:hypothetical protein HDE76_000520 [Rhodanobacter sp. ANJX3]|uniref:hypothetical protein n=1 Tax=Rhodanobacter sp. ANJX3 TaxID=2723083 RepID=UPI0016209A93|nr:hypothetical protein [Rhodanobacter sp. ANJX3]MBB5357338.1 hypothetical protein [Rhodanobacter sp. ANJX3]